MQGYLDMEGVQIPPELSTRIQEIVATIVDPEQYILERARIESNNTNNRLAAIRMLRQSGLGLREIKEHLDREFPLLDDFREHLFVKMIMNRRLSIARREQTAARLNRDTSAPIEGETTDITDSGWEVHTYANRGYGGLTSHDYINPLRTEDQQRIREGISEYLEREAENQRKKKEEKEEYDRLHPPVESEWGQVLQIVGLRPFLSEHTLGLILKRLEENYESPIKKY